MTLKKSCLFFIFMALVSGVNSEAKESIVPQISVIEPLKTSDALAQYQMRPKTELSKLIFLMDRFKGSSAEVIYNGSHYDSEFALKTAKSYMAKHYKKRESAETWIRENAYRSDPGRQVILYKELGGDTIPLRDVLLNELEELKKI